MNIWIISFVISTALAAAGFVVVAVLWLKKIREALAATIDKSSEQQMRNAGYISTTLIEIQRHQHLYEQRLQTLTEANICMRQDINTLTTKIAQSENEQKKPASHKFLH